MAYESASGIQREPGASAVAPAQPGKAVDRPRAAESAALLSGPPREEAIRLLAYSLFEERGRVGGNELDDWLKAEAILNSVNAEP